MSQTIQTPEQQLYLTHLLGYDYTIQYISGKSNKVANALSRASKDSQGSLFVLSVPHFAFLDQLKHELAIHLEFIAL